MVQNNILSGSGTADTFLQLLNEIDEQNNQYSSQRNWGCLWAVIFIALTVVLAVVLPLAVITGLIALWKLVSAWNASAKISSTTHFPFLRDTLTVLNNDAAKKKPFKIKCDFNPVEESHKQTHCDSSFWSSVTVTTYVDPWLDMLVNLSDGNNVRICAESTHVVKAKAKRKRTKYSRKYKHKVSIKLDVDPVAFRGVMSGDQIVGTTASSLTFRSVSAEGHKIRANLVATCGAVDACSVLKALSALYTLLIPVKKRRRVKKAAAAAG